MAQSEIRLPDGSMVQGNWATEETMDAVLQVLEKVHGKAGRGGGTDDKGKKDEKKAREYQSKSMQKFAASLEDLKKKIKDRVKNETDMIRTNEKAAEALDFMSDTGRSAGKAVKGLAGSTADAVEELDKLDGSARGASDAFFKVVGGAGALGAAFGVVAGIIDQFAEFQTQAIQTGFSFSQELVNTRGIIAGLGMNMKQLSDILVTNGEAVRSLGGNGAESANAFIELVGNIKTSARQFGLFGMTSEEIAGVTAERLDLLRRQGFVEGQAQAVAAQSFQMLNEEVLAYARLTGRERREIMRNNLAMREGGELLIQDLAQLGPNATTSFDSIMQSMSAVFGASGDEFAGIFGSMVEQHFMGGMERLSGDQLAALSQVPGLREIFMEARDQFIQNADNPTAMEGIRDDFARDSLSVIQSAMDNGLVSLARIQEDSPVGQLLTSIIGARQSATNYLDRTAEEIEAARSGMAPNEAELLMIRERIQVLQNEFQAMLISALTFGGKAEDLLSEDNFIAAQANITNIGEGISRVMEFFSNIGSLVTPDGSGDIANAFVGGIGAMFAAQGVVMLAMAAGVRTMWVTVGSLLTAASGGTAATTATAATAATAAQGGGFLSRIAPFLKKAGLLGTAVSGGMGVVDQEYNDAQYSAFDRFALGIFEGIADVGDFGVNAVTGAGGLLGIGPGWNNDIDMSQGFKDWINSPGVADFMQPYNDNSTSIPAFDPSTQRVNTDHMIIQGVTPNQDGSISTGMTPGNAWRHGEEGQEYLRRLADLQEEANRLMRRQIEATENQ